MVQKLTTVMMICLIFTQFAFSQQKEKYHVTESVAIKVGTTQPLGELVEKEMISDQKKKLWKATKRAPIDMKNRGLSNVVLPELEHQGPDLIRQKSYKSKSNNQIDFLVNKEGITRGSPSDPTGDIGLDYYVQAANVTKIAVYDKEGTLISQFTGNTLWSPLGFSSAGDPIVLFDQDSSRWIITEFPSGNELLVAISKTSDPLGSYDVYNFSTPYFPDYPKYALWPNALTVTTNEQGAGKLHLYALNRTQLLAGEDNVSMQRIEIEGNSSAASGFLVATPVDWSGENNPTVGEGPYFVNLDDSSWGKSDMDHVDLWELSIDWEDNTKTEIKNTEIVTAPFDPYPCKVPGVGFSCIPQPGSVGLDGIPDNIMFQPHYRKFDTHESMVMTFVTDVTDGDNLAGVRWMELRKTESTDWELYQEGTFSPDDGLHRFMSSICIDKYGNIALAYAVSSEDTYAGLRVTGRFVNDPLGQMTIQETTIVDGTNGISSGGRFGDYAHMSIDPVDGSTFWFTGEYGGNGANNATTRIASFKLRKEDFDLQVTESSKPDLILPLDSKNVTFHMNIKNNGLQPIDTFYLEYSGKSTENGSTNDFSSEKIEIDSTLAENDVYSYEFEQTQNFNLLGEHEILFVVSSSKDKFTSNDTLRKTVNVLAREDIEIDDFIVADQSSVICETEENFKATVKNNGYDTLKVFEYEVYENDNLLATLNWEGSLAYGEKVDFEFNITGLTAGQNTYKIRAKNPNGNSSEYNVSNNIDEVALKVITDSEEVVLKLSLDDYPKETSWEIKDSNGKLIYKGGDYTEKEVLEIPLCLSYGECYTFTIFDKFADGIEGGSYSIVNSKGDVLASIIQPNFGAKEVNNFCPHGGCTLAYDVVVNPTGSDDGKTGTIAINVTSGISPFEYSIDGGNSYSDNNMFDMLDDGSYDVVVRDAGNCKLDSTVMIGIVSVSNVDVSSSIKILPNPNNGYFSMEIQGADYGHRMTYIVLDANGRQILENSIWRFSNVYRGAVNLTSFPNGNYFIIFENTKLPLTKIIKQ